MVLRYLLVTLLACLLTGCQQTNYERVIVITATLDDRPNPTSSEAAAIPTETPAAIAEADELVVTPTPTITATLDTPTPTPRLDGLLSLFEPDDITSTPTATQVPPLTIDVIKRERLEMLEAINEARIAVDLPPYVLNDQLTEAAQNHSAYQRRTGDVTHVWEDGSQVIDRILDTGYPAVWVNENIYMGENPASAVEWWLTADEVTNSSSAAVRKLS